MKSVMLSVKPYWLFLIIAKTMGWKSDKEKTVEVRKSFPKDKDWNKKVLLYCTKDKKSLNQIPKEYQPFMEKFLCSVIGEFMCDKIITFTPTDGGVMFKYFSALHNTCLSLSEMLEYLNGKLGYGWYVSKLKIYEVPRNLHNFKLCDSQCKIFDTQPIKCFDCGMCGITRPPQSWCYVEELK